MIFWYEKSLIRNCLLLPSTNLSLYASHERVITVTFLVWAGFEPPTQTKKWCVPLPAVWVTQAPGQLPLEARYPVWAILSKDVGLYPLCYLIHCWGLGRYLSLCCFFIKTCQPANWDTDEWKAVNSPFSNFEHVIYGTMCWNNTEHCSALM